ncbi:hypothetical protein [Pedobacter mucosus]|uniref:hypothetical protein n=1 Tax=Pedobacter mucosus TaxID=2895286 RepID=UPI001EE482C1|nr:hypothetical protein [Pedobacter mucosus]UKT64955.1 hypothetical protein LOK61_04075 [Pedobacter mucosus]
MENLPIYVYLAFGVTVLLAIWLFYRATNHSKSFLIGILFWIIIQSLLALGGFYNNPDKLTSRFPLLILPPLLFLISLLVTKSGRVFLDRLDLRSLTLFHVIRIPVELVLFWLCVSKAVPEAMTFHGRNFDIFSGISAPIIYYFGFVTKRLNKWAIIAWNLICLLLLLNVVSSAILSLPDRFAQFGFEQPNIALGYFPFVLLPSLLVPLVLLSTIAAIKQLLKK